MEAVSATLASIFGTDKKDCSSNHHPEDEQLEDEDEDEDKDKDRDEEDDDDDDEDDENDDEDDEDEEDDEEEDEDDDENGDKDKEEGEDGDEDDDDDDDDDEDGDGDGDGDEQGKNHREATYDADKIEAPPRLSTNLARKEHDHDHVRESSRKLRYRQELALLHHEMEVAQFAKTEAGNFRRKLSRDQTRRRNRKRKWLEKLDFEQHAMHVDDDDDENDDDDDDDDNCNSGCKSLQRNGNNGYPKNGGVFDGPIRRRKRRMRGSIHALEEHVIAESAVVRESLITKTKQHPKRVTYETDDYDEDENDDVAAHGLDFREKKTLHDGIDYGETEVEDVDHDHGDDEEEHRENRDEKSISDSAGKAHRQTSTSLSTIQQHLGHQGVSETSKSSRTSRDTQDKSKAESSLKSPHRTRATKGGNPRKGRLLYRMKNFKSQKMALLHGDALGAHARGNHTEAIQKLKAVASEAPDAPQVYSSLGLVYEDMMLRRRRERARQRQRATKDSAGVTGANLDQQIANNKNNGRNRNKPETAAPRDHGHDHGDETNSADMPHNQPKPHEETGTKTKKEKTRIDTDTAPPSAAAATAHLEKEIEIAKKAYGSYHAAAVLCKKDFTLWIRAADSASEIADLFGEAMLAAASAAAAHRHRTHIDNHNHHHHHQQQEECDRLIYAYRAERRRWTEDSKRDYTVADNLKPPGIDVPAKLAAAQLVLGNLTEALTILTDLKNREVPASREDRQGASSNLLKRNDFGKSYKTWMLYADLMLRLGYECTQWKKRIRVIESYMLKRWLRKFATSFDWQERRLQALVMALEAAAGTESCRALVAWASQRNRRGRTAQMTTPKVVTDRDVRRWHMDTYEDQNPNEMTDGAKNPQQPGDDDGEEEDKNDEKDSHKPAADDHVPQAQQGDGEKGKEQNNEDTNEASEEGNRMAPPQQGDDEDGEVNNDNNDDVHEPIRGDDHAAPPPTGDDGRKHGCDVEDSQERTTEGNHYVESTVQGDASSEKEKGDGDEDSASPTQHGGYHEVREEGDEIPHEPAEGDGKGAKSPQGDDDVVLPVRGETVSKTEDDGSVPRHQQGGYGEMEDDCRDASHKPAEGDRSGEPSQKGNLGASLPFQGDTGGEKEDECVSPTQQGGDDVEKGDDEEGISRGPAKGDSGGVSLQEGDRAAAPTAGLIEPRRKAVQFNIDDIEYSQIRSNLLAETKAELKAFDEETETMVFLNCSVEANARADARQRLREEHKKKLVDFVGRFAQRHRMTVSQSWTQDKLEPLPLSASCAVVCSIASELMKCCLGLELYDGGRLVGEAVSLYLKKRATMRTQRFNSNKSFTEKQRSTDQSILMNVEDYDQIQDDGSGSSDEEWEVGYLSDDEIIDGMNTDFVHSLENGILPSEIQVLYALCLFGEGDRKYVAAKCIQAIEDLSSDDDGMISTAAEKIDMNIISAPEWQMFRSAMVDPLQKVPAYAFVADLLRKTRGEKEWSDDLVGLFQKQVSSMRESGLEEEALTIQGKLSPPATLLKNQTLKIVMASGRLTLSNLERRLIRNASSDAPRILRGLMSRFHDILKVTWKVSHDGSLSKRCVEVLGVLSQGGLLFAEHHTKFEEEVTQELMLIVRSIVDLITQSYIPHNKRNCGDKDAQINLSSLPFRADWQLPRELQLATRSHNLAVSCEVANFPGWNERPFHPNLLKRKCDSNYFGVVLHHGRISGRIDQDTESKLLAQWKMVNDLQSDSTFDFANEMRLTKSRALWYDDENSHGKRGPIASFGEENGFLLLVSYASLCLQLVDSNSSEAERQKNIRDALSIMLPITQFCLDIDIWTSDLGKLAFSSTADAGSNHLKEAANDSKLKALLRAPNPIVDQDEIDAVMKVAKEKKRMELEKIRDQWAFGQTSAQASIKFIRVANADLMAEWNKFEGDHVRGTTEKRKEKTPTDSAMDAAAAIDQAVRTLRKCSTESSAQKAAVDVAKALIDLAANESCSFPLDLLQHAAIYATQCPKGGNHDHAFKSALPTEKGCTPREALVILGRADCLQALHRLVEAIYLCSFVARICRMHRDRLLEDFPWTPQWKVVGVVAYNTSIHIRITTCATLGKDAQQKLSKSWDLEAIEELERGRYDANRLKRLAVEGQSPMLEGGSIAATGAARELDEEGTNDHNDDAKGGDGDYIPADEGVEGQEDREDRGMDDERSIDEMNDTNKFTDQNRSPPTKVVAGGGGGSTNAEFVATAVATLLDVHHETNDTDQDKSFGTPIGDFLSSTPDMGCRGDVRNYSWETPHDGILGVTRGLGNSREPLLASSDDDDNNLHVGEIVEI